MNIFTGHVPCIQVKVFMTEKWTSIHQLMLVDGSNSIVYLPPIQMDKCGRISVASRTLGGRTITVHVSLSCRVSETQARDLLTPFSSSSSQRK